MHITESSLSCFGVPFHDKLFFVAARSIAVVQMEHCLADDFAVRH